jgi:CDP-diacylglycerol---serine O-phosphatidyltransferase
MVKLPRLPDLLTTANLCCGVGSILLASQGQLTLACWLVFAGAFFDVLDGLAARALGGGSELGKQLDSLADMVTFGVAPGVLVLFAINPFEQPYGPQWIDFIPMLIPIASAWRLAKFNLDTRQASGFLGLPTPANGLFWAGLLLGSNGQAVQSGPAHEKLVELSNIILHSGPWMPLLVVVLSALMLSELPLPGLKFKHFKWQGNQVIFLLLGIGAVLVVLYGILAVPLIMVLYILSPLWGRVFGKVV